MDSTTIASILGVLGFITSILSIIYARQQTQSAKEQVKFLREESEKKKNLQKASKEILEAIEIMKKSWKVRQLKTLNTFRDEILSYMHDTKTEKLTLKIMSEPLHLSTKPDEDVVITNEEMLFNKMKLWADEKIEIKGQFKINVKPHDTSHFQTEFIDITDLLKEVQSYFVAQKMIKAHADAVRSFDNGINGYLDENENELEILVANVYSPTSEERELTFSISNSSLEMLQKLSFNWFHFDMIADLRELICGDELDKIVSVQSKIFELAQ